ncbi:putative transposase for insertion sequence element IS629 [Mycobacteroides abscessus subsp. bolletii 103]|nr:putative transposase for insertion sequence element IS629 [Mycobacteroides abscessus subsp. bolletii 103]
MGAPAAPGHPGSALHGRTDHAHPRLARATRARTIRTTERDPAAARAPDLVRRRFHASRPNLLVVADFTYVPLDGGGFGYTAFVIDAYAGLIAGWECSLTKNTAFVERAIRQATAYRRGRDIGSPVTRFITATPDHNTLQHISLRH